MNRISLFTSRRLSGQILSRVLLFGVLVVTIATISCYFLVYHHSKERSLATMRQYMVERKQVEDQLFAGAYHNLTFFRDEFLLLYLSPLDFSDDEFWEIYFVDGDGATRMKEQYFTESIEPHLGRSWGVTSFIGNNQSVASHDFKRRLLIAYLLVNRYGPAWAAQGVLHASYPENAITIYSPGAPWGLQAKPDLPMNELGTIKATLQSENPARTPVWTGLYYDETVGQWTITFELPVDYQGRHLVNPSLDLYLTAIMERLDNDSQAGTYSLILSKNGYLIAHPGKLKDELKQKGQLSLDKIGDPALDRIFHQIALEKADAEGISVIEDVQGDNYLIAAALTGPDWWLVTVLPKQLIAHEAHQTARIVLLFGFLLFVVYYVTVYLVIGKQVKAPLAKLQQAISLVAAGDYQTVIRSPQQLPLEQQNEIGGLAGTFLDMCRQVNEAQTDLQGLVNSRTRELETANAQLRELSLLDGLTGIHNRRSLDRDIEAVFNQAQNNVESFFLLLVDIDYFKAFNDIYGHTAGDETLRAVAQVIATTIRKVDRAYRYGGEEFAVIFNSADHAAAHVCGERLVEAVQNTDIPHRGSPHGIITVSAGLVGYSSRFQSVTELIDVADACLYQAKNSGRNCLRINLAADDSQTG